MEFLVNHTQLVSIRSANLINVPTSAILLQFYEFTDLPMTEAARGEYASGTQVQEYIER
jgi:hypothetical protein